MNADNDLGSYLRARRDAVTPKDVGLAPGPSRRVPGLRREEVALLAGVSTDYYTRIEQGRERIPSPQVLQAIARVLRLDGPAAAHMFRLGGYAPQATAAPDSVVTPELLRMMDSLHDLPAFVVGRAQDILAANAIAEELYSGFQRFDNLLRMIFLDPFAREFYADWDQVARIAVGNLRASAARFPDDERIERITGALTVRSEAFTAHWMHYDVRPRTREVKEFRHPEVGSLRLSFESMAVESAPGQNLSVYGAEPGSSSADALVLLRRLSEQRLAEEHPHSPQRDLAWNGGFE
ncbi:helix-turn-helix transcriptional regulator [Mycobacterium sp. ITM-2016-00317]|uniref:helix-turn-helix domain-containing protein n=1 Tax=Mycobacterium sp. ITM-2016-00317 TaxID=2099694 RepID=UPI000D476F11|nr:helix-turn-helix transcriptional regulator [Mycobacterium sp. ITM-2016-00317]WNG85905.1 helix-turn-helix transcriptional regulator [Mycobacterium sp. ITM-2016-00317]